MLELLFCEVHLLRKPYIKSNNRFERTQDSKNLVGFFLIKRYSSECDVKKSLFAMSVMSPDVPAFKVRVS